MVLSTQSAPISVRTNIAAGQILVAEAVDRNEQDRGFEAFWRTLPVTAHTTLRN